MGVAVSSPAEGLSSQQKMLTLAGLLLAIFLSALDQTIVATAGPEIQKALGIEPSLYAWITTAYLVASTVLVPVYGKLSDTYGRRRIVVIGVLIFLGGSVGCGLSQSTTHLIFFRAVQGVGSASIFTSAFAVVADLFSPRERGRYVGLFSGAFAVSSVVGPLVGGLITDALGWHWVFFINVPLGALALTFIGLRMPALRPTGPTGRVDVPGAVLLVAGAVPLLLALSLGRPVVRPGETGFAWLSAPELLLFAVAAVGLTGFVAHERRTQTPLMDLRLFREPVVAWGSAATFVLGAVFLLPMVFLPLFMVNVTGASATSAGLTITPLVLSVTTGNVLAGQLVTRLGRYRRLMLGALVLLMAALALLAFTLSPDSSRATLTVKMVLLGLGLGPTIPLYTLAIQNAAPSSQMGVATSMATFFRQLGATAGLALMGSLFGGVLMQHLETRTAEALASAPPAMAELLRVRPDAGGGEAGPAQGHFDATKVKAEVDAQLDTLRDVAKRAAAGDAAAAAALAQSGWADARLRSLGTPGGVAARVEHRFEATRQRLETASTSAEAWRRLQTGAGLRPEVLALVRATPAEAMDDDDARPGAMAAVESQLATLEASTQAQLTERANAEVDKAVGTMRARATQAVDSVEAAVKASFTDALRLLFAVALAVAVLGFALTWRVPDVALRGPPQMPVME